MKLLCLIFAITFLSPDVETDNSTPSPVGEIMPPAARVIVDPPAITPFQETMLQQLADPSFVKREQASKYFSNNPYDCLLILRKGLSEKDQEIKSRCESILQKYCWLDIQDVSIWDLSNNLRFTTEDVALKYYTTAYEVDGTYSLPIWYQIQDISVAATRYYVADLLLQGWTRKNVEELTAEMRWNKKYMKHIDPGLMDTIVFGFVAKIPKNSVPSPLIPRHQK